MGRHRSRYRLMPVTPALQFITGNLGKFREVQAVLPGIQQLNLELDEIQGLDPRLVIEHKLTQAAGQHAGAFIVEDTSLIFHCLGNLPGPLIKWFVEALGNDGMVDLVHRYPNHNVTAKTTIGYRSATGQIHYFIGQIDGQLVSPRGTLEPFGWNPIFQPQGHDQTFAEMTIAQKNAISMRGRAAAALKQFLQANQ